MATEFRGEVFADPVFVTGEDVLKFYEIEDTNIGHDVSSVTIGRSSTVESTISDTSLSSSFLSVCVEYAFETKTIQMFVLAGYTIILHLLSFVVLYIRYSWFTGLMLPFHNQ